MCISPTPTPSIQTVNMKIFYFQIIQMSASNEKTIHDYRYCDKRQTRKNFSGYIWPNIERNYKFYSLIDNPSTFQALDTLYSFTESTTDCRILRRNDYLLKLANATAFFGVKYIIKPLNDYCRENIDEPETTIQKSYSAPLFRQWTDVTDYIGNRHNPAIPSWEQDKMQRVYDQIRIIAQQNGISSQFWDVLTSLYHDRNQMCHRTPTTADTNSITEYANLTDNPMERDSVKVLSDLVTRALQTRRRARR
jgi:hypothetical protein